MGKVTIKILAPDQRLADLYGQPTDVYLDVGDDLEIRLTKSLEELTEAEKIAREASLSGNVPMTPKNRAILARYDANIWQRKNRAFSIRVEVRYLGQPLYLDRLQVIDTSDPDRQYEVELFGGGWINDLEDCPLNELDLPIFEYTLANVLSAWGDRRALAVPTLSDYGGWNSPGDVTRKDLRFRFNLYELLKLAFCQATSYEFYSPYLEAAAGAHLYGYLSPPSWYSYSEKGDQFRVLLEIATPQNLTGNTEFLLYDEVYDPFDLYNSVFRPTEYLYPPAGLDEIKINFTGSITVELPPSDPAPTFIYLVYKNFPAGGIFDYVYYDTIQGSTTETVRETLTFEFSDQANNNGTSYGVLVQYGYAPPGATPVDVPFTIESGELNIYPDPPYYIEDDTIPLAELLDPALNCLDLFKATLEVFNGKLETRQGENRVTAYPPYPVTVLGEFIEGFYQRNGGYQNLEDIVQVNSRKVKNQVRDQERYILLKWADSDDPYLEERTEGDVYARTVDLGYGKAGKPKEIENSLFEPTIERQTAPEETGGTGLYLPVLYDNLNGEISTDIGPRIGYHYGAVEQETGAGILTFSFEGVERSEFGYITQRPTVPRSNGEQTVPIIFAEDELDLWRLFYRRWLLERFSLVEFEFLLKLDLARYNGLSFRKPVGFFYAETFLLYQLLEIRDFDITGTTTTPATLRLIEC